MKQYLTHSYPTESITQMLFMGKTAESFRSTKREIAFSYDNPEFGYPRQTVTREKEFKEVLERKNPTQVHMQSLRTESIYSREIQCELRELVFDIDVTDFNRYCHCVKQPGQDQKRTCSSCWQHIEGASLVLDHILKVQWGLAEENILWVLSGMKGFHCIVNDKRFMRMTHEERTSLYIQLQRSTDKQLIQFASSLRPEFSSRVQKEFFSSSIIKRGLMNSDKFEKSCLTFIKAEYYNIYNPLVVKWFNLTTASSREKWEALLELERNQFPGRPLPSLVIALRCYYPKIDKGPFCEKNHISKLPFSIHNTTRRVALPVEREGLYTEATPSITLSDVNAYYRENGVDLPTLEESKKIFQRWVNAYDK